MKVVFSAPAAEELDDILLEMVRLSPKAFIGFNNRLWSVIRQIGEWPWAAQMVAGRPGIRMVPLQRYPSHVFYRVLSTTVEVVHIRHGARAYPDE